VHQRAVVHVARTSRGSRRTAADPTPARRRGVNRLSVIRALPGRDHAAERGEHPGAPPRARGNGEAQDPGPGMGSL
jgi:hypothetical protein